MTNCQRPVIRVTYHRRMTGLDPTALVGKAVEAAADVAQAGLGEHKARNDQLRQAAEGTSEMQQAGRLYGQRAAITQRALLSLLTPLKWAHLVPERYFEEEFYEDLAAKLEPVPLDDLQTPRSNVAIPAIQGLALNLDEPALKEMYLNLLADASTTSRASLVHPSFVHVLQQLSSEEVPTLDWCLREKAVPAVRVKLVGPSGWTLEILRNCLVDRPVSSDQFERWLANWESLGLVELALGGEYALVDRESIDSGDEMRSRYGWVEQRPEVAEERAQIKARYARDPLPGNIDFIYGAVRATPRGLDFYRVVTSD